MCALQAMQTLQEDDTSAEAPAAVEGRDWPTTCVLAGRRIRRLQPPTRDTWQMAVWLRAAWGDHCLASVGCPALLKCCAEDCDSSWASARALMQAAVRAPMDPSEAREVRTVEVAGLVWGALHRLRESHLSQAVTGCRALKLTPVLD